MPTDAPAFQPRPFGRYYLVDKMAIGGMAEVFNAVFFGIHDFEMPLVVKRILPHLSANQRFVDMFVVEAKIYVVLQHQNIVQIYDFNKFQDQYFIALEFVEGRDLKSVLQRCQSQQVPLASELGLFIAHQICHGLEYAHTRVDDNNESLGLVHRDLSPANILLSYTGDVKIADFGIAKAKMHAEITNSGVLKGKYRYMSPEQARGEEIDHRSDVYALGILLYEMLTGTQLYTAESDTELLALVRNGIFEEPRKRNPKLTPRINQIICRALHPSVNGRFQSARDLQQALAEEIHPNTVSSLSRQLSTFLDELFVVDKKADRLRRRHNRDLAWAQFQELEASVQDMDLDLLEESEDLVSEQTENGPTGNSKSSSSSTLNKLEQEELRVYKRELERTARMLRMSIAASIVLTGMLLASWMS